MARNRNRGRAGSNSTRGVHDFTDMPGAWVVSTSNVGDTGSTGMGVSNYGGAAQTLAAGSTFTYAPLQLIPAATAAAAPPTIGEVDIVGLDAHVDITSVSLGGLFTVGLGLYVSKYNLKSGLWEVMRPTEASDGASASWLNLATHSFNAPLAAAEATIVSVTLRVVLPYKIRIGLGMALHVTLENDSASAGTITYVPFIRARIDHVA